MVAPSPVSILVIMAHSDDAELWAGATLATAHASGSAVTIAIPRHSPERDAEAAASADILGATLTALTTVTTQAIHDLLITARPEVAITHHPDDTHPDHRTVAESVNAALPNAVITTGYPRRVYACDSYNNLDRHGHPLHLPTIIDGTASWPTKKRALAMHRSQPIVDHFGPMADTLGQLHGRRIGTTYAEAFQPQPILGRIPPRSSL